MWKCKHCNNEFEFDNTSSKANHSRWCEANPKRNNTENLVKAQEKINNDKLGILKDFKVVCFNCEKEVIVTEREKQFPLKERYFCDRRCANSQGGKVNANNIEKSGEMGYRSVAQRNHPKECIVCGFDKVLEVHHVDENHSNNDFNNLVWLCPNHHQMFHSKYKSEIEPYVQNYIKQNALIV